MEISIMLDEIKESVQERENGIEGKDAQELLAEMKRIVAEAEANENKAGGKAID